MRKGIGVFSSILLLCCLLTGCQPAEPEILEAGSRVPELPLVEPEVVEPGPVSQPEEEVELSKEPEAQEPIIPEPEKHLIAIDAGHQAKGDYSTEPIGPGASEQKAKVSSGTQGRFTGLAEYELNLTVATLLREELEDRGYEVLMIRESNDVSISNMERAAMANEAGADAFIRIHANGSEDPSVNGIMTLCMTPGNPYNSVLYPQSRALADALLDGMVEATGANRQSVWETDIMSGINHAQVPVSIVEMGYMTNETEDHNLATAAYQQKLAEGMANGLDQFFAGQEDSNAPVQTDSALQQALDTALEGLSSRWDVYVEDLTTGEIASAAHQLPADGKMVSASLIKLFIMGAVYEQVEAGMLTESQVDADVHSMITISDNSASNRLTKLLGGGDAAKGMAVVNAFAKSLGCEHTELNRLMLDDNGLQNYVSAADCAAILKAIYTGTCVNVEYSATMLEHLKGQQVNNRIPAGVPGDTIVAHKTGDLSGLSCGDVGIVLGPERDYIICVICNDPYTDGGAAAKIVEISQQVYAVLQS